MAFGIQFAWLRERTRDTVTVGTDLTNIITMDVRGWQRCTFTLVNGTTALNAFQVRMKTHWDQTKALTTMNAAAHFANPDNVFLGITINDNTTVPVLQSTTDLTTLPASYSAMFGFNVLGIAEIELWASVAAATSVVTLYTGSN